MDSLNKLVPRSQDVIDWGDAYERVENYLGALQIQDRLLLSQLVANILSRAAERVGESEKSPSVLAMEEAKKVVETWYGQVLDAAGLDHTELGSQGRLALFLSDMPRRWQGEFLHEGPWPDDFLKAIKATHMTTGPEFSKGQMTPRDIDLGPVSAVADETWRVIDRWPIIGAVLVWGFYIGLVGLVVYLLR